ncbi:hypothetical protein FC19_GL000135 [Liquorilactobacillus aquaticus DSM 21051]|uniref:Uncharacterized protein n=1 Tax=Liquorilactobacillus aquaticus DSM 21051 TaxID=1423725 RepID=A0A0R2D3B4_9LACO|nr:hypothetical protein [Liquorilactobacillus aquaticus]KRM94875.1 hypothetical protein FC19_GL000135 [Liquorilactobacillus aquaticus DSM 21051]
MYRRIVEVNTSRIEDIIALGEFDQDIEIQSRSTLLVLDCQKYNIKNVKSIVFDIHKGICLSNYETKKLVNRYVERNAVTFAFTRAMVRYMDFKGILPYVYGETIMIPLTGVTQRSTDWFFLNNVSSYIFSSSENKVILNCEKVFNIAFKIVIETNPAFCKRAIGFAKQMYELENQLLCKLIADFYPSCPLPKFCMLENDSDTSKKIHDFKEDYHKMFTKYILQAQDFSDPTDELLTEIYTEVKRRMNRLM